MTWCRPLQEPTGYAQPVYTTSYGTNDNNNVYAAGAVGAVAGLTASAFLGSTFSGASDRGSRNQTTTTTSYFAGDSGGGGGGDFSGDS